MKILSTKEILYLRRLILILAIAILTGACGRKDGDAANDDRPVIAVSTPALGRLVKEIAGDEFRVVVLLPTGADPENYEPEMTSMKATSQADALLTLNTVGFEQTLADRIAGVMPNLKILNVAEEIEFMEHSHGGEEYLHGAGDHEHEDAHCDDDHVHADPHLLSSIRNARIITANIEQALAEMYPAKREKMRARALSLDSLMAKRDEEIRGILGRGGKSFLVMHPSMSYFARDYGLYQIPLERDGKEPSPRQLAERIEEAKDRGAEVMVIDRSESASSAASIASQMKLRTVATDFNAADFLEQYIPAARSLINFN